MIEKADNALSSINDFLKSTTDRIGPNTVLFIALLNGALIGLVTTGYLGSSSIPVKSFTFVLIIWQFTAICLLTARYVDLTIKYLNKFMLSGLVGFFWQWQVFAGFYPTETFLTPFEGGGSIFMWVITVQVFLGHCLTGNQKNTAKNMYVLDKDKSAA